MIFGLVTRRELEKRLQEAADERHRELEEIRFEWARWFDKFRSLYAMLLKREKKTSQDAPGSTNGDEPAAPSPTGSHAFPHSRRGW